jgi:hypothetical protein
MAITTDDIQVIQQKIKGLIGKKVWAPKLGVGSFITCEFGNPLPPNTEGSVHGEWHLWTYCCAWRLEQSDEVVVGSEDNRDDLEKAVQILEGRTLENVVIASPAGESQLYFSGSIVLRLFPVFYVGDYEHWMLFTPEGRVLTIGPGSTWSYSDPAATS